MDRGTLATLRGMIRPLAPTGTLTMERAAAIASLNFEIARFHADLAQAERILAIAGGIDQRHQQELVARALHLERQREVLAGGFGAQGPTQGVPQLPCAAEIAPAGA